MRTLEFICFETACIGLGVIMEAFTPLTSLWIWIPVTSLAIIGFIVALLERHIRALFSASVWAEREVERAERGARRDRLASLKSMVAYVRREPYFSKLVVDFENQSVSGEPRIPRSYIRPCVFGCCADWELALAQTVCDGQGHSAEGVGKWAGYSIQ